MSTNESWQSVASRGQASTAIWRTHSPGFTVGEVTLPLHQADVDNLPIAAQPVVTQEDAVDTARNGRAAVIAVIKDLAVRFPRKLDGELAARDPFHADLQHIRVVEMDGLDTVVTRGQRALSLWVKFNTRRVAAGGTAFLVGGHAVAVLSGALVALPTKTQLVADATSILADLRSALLALKDKVDTNNKRWYAAWQGEFLPGSPERDALSQIDTGTPTPLPDVLVIVAPLTAVDGTTVQVDYVPGGGDHATELSLQFYAVGEAEWGHSVAVAQPSQVVNHAAFEQGLVRFRTRGANSTGEVFSPVVEIQM